MDSRRSDRAVPTVRIHGLRILVHVDSWDDGHPEINPRFEKRSQTPYCLAIRFRRILNIVATLCPPLPPVPPFKTGTAKNPKSSILQGIVNSRFKRCCVVENLLRFRNFVAPPFFLRSLNVETGWLKKCLRIRFSYLKIEEFLVNINFRKRQGQKIARIRYLKSEKFTFFFSLFSIFQSGTVYFSRQLAFSRERAAEHRQQRGYFWRKSHNHGRQDWFAEGSKGKWNGGAMTLVRVTGRLANLVGLIDRLFCHFRRQHRLSSAICQNQNGTSSNRWGCC